jgi:hypothetical protein
MSERKFKEVIKFLGRCLKENGVKVTKIILFGSQVKGKTTKEAEIMTLKKFMMFLDIVTLTSEEFESGTSLVAEYARKGKVMYAA